MWNGVKNEAMVSSYGEYVAVESCAGPGGRTDVVALHGAIRKAGEAAGQSVGAVMCIGPEGATSAAVPIDGLSAGDRGYCSLWATAGDYIGAVPVTITDAAPGFAVNYADLVPSNSLASEKGATTADLTLLKRLGTVLCNQGGGTSETLVDDAADGRDDLGADIIATCSAGGSADLSSEGVVYIWNESGFLGKQTPKWTKLSDALNACSSSQTNLMNAGKDGQIEGLPGDVMDAPFWAVIGTHATDELVGRLVNEQNGYVTCAHGQTGEG
jgi:hypothetical protein